MNNKIAHDIYKAENRDLKQRAQSRDKMSDSFKLGVLGVFQPLNQKDTDYPPLPNLANIPMKAREKSRITPWPVEQRAVDPVYQPESRNLGGTIWRRYPNGVLSVDEAVAAVEAAVMKLNRGLVPPDENDALILASVWPNLQFTNMPKHIVEIKARLSPNERDALRAATRIWPKSIPKP